MDSSQWPQGIEGLVVRPVETAESQKPVLVEKKPRPPKEQALNCPRCHSTNTKFCYYNNYSLSQPRYFCKNCRRYWTEGGSLRNVPVGGGSRKNKRCSSSSSTTASSSKKLVQDLNPQPSFLSANPKIQHGHDLNLAYSLNPFLPEFPFGLDVKTMNNTSSSKATHLSSLDLLKPVTFTSGQSSTFMADNSSNNSNVYCSSLPVHDLKSGLGFSLDGLNQNVYGGSPSSRLLFPFDELKPVSSANEFGRDEATGYWNGVLDGGSW